MKAFTPFVLFFFVVLGSTLGQKLGLTIGNAGGQNATVDFSNRETECLAEPCEPASYSLRLFHYIVGRTIAMLMWETSAVNRDLGWKIFMVLERLNGDSSMCDGEKAVKDNIEAAVEDLKQVPKDWVAARAAYEPTTQRWKENIQLLLTTQVAHGITSALKIFNQEPCNTGKYFRELPKRYHPEGIPDAF